MPEDQSAKLSHLRPGSGGTLIPGLRGTEAEESLLVQDLSGLCGIEKQSKREWSSHKGDLSTREVETGAIWREEYMEEEAGVQCSLRSSLRIGLPLWSEHW